MPTPRPEPEPVAAEDARTLWVDIDEVTKKITNKPRAYYVLKKLRDDGIIVEADKAGKSKTHYIFKK